jgi:hypothetical protein
VGFSVVRLAFSSLQGIFDAMPTSKETNMLTMYNMQVHITAGGVQGGVQGAVSKTRTGNATSHATSPENKPQPNAPCNNSIAEP